MVNELLVQEEGVIPGCFVHGAGEVITHTYTHTHTHTHTRTRTAFIHTHTHHLLDQ